MGLTIKIKPKAIRVIDDIADFVESKNTTGSGARYALRFKAAIEKIAQSNIQYALCHHPVLAAYKYSCSQFNDWVIVFRIEEKVLTVYEIIHGSLLF